MSNQEKINGYSMDDIYKSMLEMQSSPTPLIIIQNIEKKIVYQGEIFNLLYWTENKKFEYDIEPQLFRSKNEAVDEMKKHYINLEICFFQDLRSGIHNPYIPVFCTGPAPI